MKRFLFVVSMALCLAGCGSPDIACTMEAKQCPDGSYVGRDPGANCAFKPCPAKR